MRLLGKIIAFAMWSVVRLAALLVIFCVGLGLRLTSGPVEMSVPQSLLDRAVAEAAPGWHVAASGAEIDFSSDDGLNGLKLRDVVLSDPGGKEVTSVPQIGLRFRLSPSLNPADILKVREVALSGASLGVLRDTDGAFRLSIGDLADMGGADGDPIASLSELGDLGDLPRLRIEDAQVSYTDLARGSTWQTEKARLLLTPDEKGLAASLAVVIDGGIGGAQLEAFHSVETGEVTATIQLNEVRPSRVARLDPVLAPLARVDAPLSGRVALLADDGGTFRRASGQITATRGLLAITDQPIALDAFAADIACDFDSEGCEIADLSFDAPDLSVRARGTIQQTDSSTAALSLRLNQTRFRDHEIIVEAGQSTLAASINTQTGAVVLDQIATNDVAVGGLPDGRAVAFKDGVATGSYDPSSGSFSLPSFVASDVAFTDTNGVRQTVGRVSAALSGNKDSSSLTLSNVQATGLLFSAEGAGVSISNINTAGVVDLGAETATLSTLDLSGLSVSAEEAGVSVSSAKAEVTYNVSSGNLTVAGLDATGITVNSLEGGVSVGHLLGAATLDVPSQRIVLAPTTLTEVVAVPAQRQPSRFSSVGVSGTVDLAQKSFQGGSLSLRDAIVSAPEIYTEPVHIGEAQTQFTAYSSNGASQVTVQDLRATINGLPAHANGQLTIRADKTLAGSVNAALGTVQLSELPRHWPLGVAPGGLRWVSKNVKSGSADNFTVNAQFDEAQPQNDTLDLRFGFRDAMVSFIPEMPPIQHAQGSGHVTLDRLDVGLTSGSIYTSQAGPLSLSGSSFAIADFSPDIPFGDIQVRASGDVQSVLRLLDTEPLGVISPTGFDIASATGQSDVQVLLTLPLAENVRFDDVRFDARAKVHKYSLIEPETQAEVKGDLLQVKATPDGLTLQSDARIGGLAARLGYSLGFGKALAGEPNSILTLESFLSLNDFARHGLVLDDHIEGLTAMSARIEMFDGGAARINADADLTNVALKIDRVGWRKESGVAATMRLSGFRNPNGVGRVEALELRGDGLSADGSIGFDQNGEVTRANFSRIVLGSAVDTGLVYGQKTSGNVGVLLKGARLDLRRAFADVIEGQGTHNQPTRGGPETDIRVEIGRVFLRDDLGVFDVQGGIRLRGDSLHAANVTGRLNGSAPAKLLAERRPEGMALRLTSPDAGAFIRATDVFTGAYDGKLQLDAVTRTTVSPSQIAGRILVSDMVVHDAPTLGRILSGGAISTLMSDLKNGGIQFSKIELPFQGAGSQWQIQDGVAFGPQIGLTLDGGYDVAHRRLALNGSVSPAYAINGALGNVPLLGKLLTGGEGGGVFGVTFSVDGDTNQPVVQVNPLSALAPGFLRKIVAEVGKSRGSGQQSFQPNGAN